MGLSEPVVDARKSSLCIWVHPSWWRVTSKYIYPSMLSRPSSWSMIWSIVFLIKWLDTWLGLCIIRVTFRQLIDKICKQEGRLCNEQQHKNNVQNAAPLRSAVEISHLFMLTSIYPSVLHFPHPSPLHSFSLNSKLPFLVNLFPHRSLTIATSDWLPRLMGPFSVFTVFVGVISCFCCGRQN